MDCSIQIKFRSTHFKNDNVCHNILNIEWLPVAGLGCVQQKLSTEVACSEGKKLLFLGVYLTYFDRQYWRIVIHSMTENEGAI